MEKRELLEKWLKAVKETGIAAKGSIREYKRKCGSGKCRKCASGERHSTQYFRKKIAELERETLLISQVTRSMERHAQEYSLQLEDERRRRITAEKELEHVRLENAELRVKVLLWESNGRDMHAELGKMDAFSQAQRL